MLPLTLRQIARRLARRAANSPTEYTAITPPLVEIIVDAEEFGVISSGGRPDIDTQMQNGAVLVFNQARYRRNATTGYLEPVNTGNDVVLTPDLPTMDVLEPYRVPGTNNFVGIPYGPATWAESALGGQVLAQVIDLYAPTGGTVPPGGSRFATWTHATGGDRIIAGGYLNNNTKLPLLAAGYWVVQVEFRHPVSNQDQGAPHNDVAKAVQFVRSIAHLLNIDKTEWYAFCMSRGNLVAYTTTKADIANPAGVTYAERQSSIGCKAIYSKSGQFTYNPVQWATRFGTTSAANAFIAANPVPAGVVMGSYFDEVMAAPPERIPHTVMLHDLPYYTTRQGYTFGVNLNSIDDPHFPNNAVEMAKAYAARGLSDRFVSVDGIDEADKPGDHTHWQDVLPFFDNVASGMSGAEAWACATMLRRSGTTNDAGIFYARTPLSGVRSSTDGVNVSTTVPAVGDPVGAVIDGKYGIANRLVDAPLGLAAGQTSAGSKPSLSQQNGQYAVNFVSNSRLLIVLANASSTQSYADWTTVDSSTVPANRNTGTIFVGQPNLTGKKLVLAIAHKSTNALEAPMLRGMSAFADVLSGGVTNHRALPVVV